MSKIFDGKLIAHNEISVMGFEPGALEIVMQYVIWNLKVIQTKGEFKFTEIGHEVLLL